MPGFYPFEKLIKYPHLKPIEVSIWERFIEKYPDFFTSVDYDVKVGTPRGYKDYPDDTYKKGLQELSLKRIDAIGYKNDEISIIEIKPSADLEAFGQLIGERDLWMKAHPEIKKVSLVLVTDFELPDMRELSLRYKIQYFVV